MYCQPRSLRQVYNWIKNNQSCLLCDEPAETGLPLCASCEAELPWLGAHCAICALPLPAADLVCGACQKRPPAFDRVEAPWRYAFPVDTLIARFKHQARWPLGRLLGELLARHLQHAYAEGLPRPDGLLPVPLAQGRLRRRGFNQAHMLARWLGRPLELSVEEHLLLRLHDTPAQQELDAIARRRNLRGAFALADPAAVAGRHLALVDDVLTTGATVEALARLLRAAGAARVDVYCLARTPKADGR
ncbi:MULTISPECIES: ComF family protein [Azotobacter]|uniref:ComF family protein n=1 Tax=Azotobacter TaxID=352 RepID=UPI00003890D0|nr:ComF family protein [Azotobacter vinelandii]GLK60164.1 amidophosphoribosyltransferase [Azotobacter vinelandii]SFX66851.1 comF family protein [Azotobacter vinelandii]